MKNKKAIGAYDIVYWSIRILFVLFMFGAIVFLARVYENQTLDTSYTEAVVFVKYMVYNPNALPYVDTLSGRTYPGIIDLSKFNQVQLESAMYFGENNNMVAAKITLDYEGLAGESEEEDEFWGPAPTEEGALEIYYNFEKYLIWLPLTSSAFKGPGTVRRLTETKYVLVKDGEKTYPGFITFNVLVPRT